MIIYGNKELIVSFLRNEYNIGSDFTLKVFSENTWNIIIIYSDNDGNHENTYRFLLMKKLYQKTSNIKLCNEDIQLNYNDIKKKLRIEKYRLCLPAITCLKIILFSNKDLAL
jgi:hypothetical protein